MKQLILFVFVLCTAASAYCQDLIVTVTGDSLRCKIVDIEGDKISFRFEKGYIITIKKSEVLSHQYNFIEAQRDIAFLREREFSIYGGYGLSTFSYKLLQGDMSGGYGGDYGFGYSYVFHRKWGIYTGVGLVFYNAQAKLDGVQTVTTDLIDSNNLRFDMYAALDGYSETHKAAYLNIPVMALFQPKREQGFYAMCGVKLGIPLSGKYSSQSATLTNKGYYPEFDNWATSQKFAGFGVFEGKKFDGNLELGVSFTLALEAGIKRRIGKNLSLYAGAYFDYGLNSIVKNQPFVGYTAANPSDFSVNSVLSTFTDKVNMMAAGVKVRVAWKK